MKKLFISCPMKGRTEENIRNSINRMHKLAEIIFDQQLEIANLYVPNDAPDSGTRPIWYLGESIKKMSEADYFIGIDYSKYFKECVIEARVAQAYDIPWHLVEMRTMMPDANDIDRNARTTMIAVSNN